MNKTKIEWTDFTYNPISGCSKRCFYCYAWRLAKGRLRKFYLSNPNVAPGCDPDDPFSPRFWPGRLDEPCTLRRPSKIFVCSMGELFDPRVPDEWIEEVLAVARFCERHTFQFLTKQPQRAAQFDFPSNAWVGVTATDDFMESNVTIARLRAIQAPVRFISYEPLLDAIPSVPCWVNWIIIGAMTGPGAIKPEPEWVQHLIDLADAAGIPVFLKDNLGWKEPRQEWPTPKEDYREAH